MSSFVASLSSRRSRWRCNSRERSVRNCVAALTKGINSATTNRTPLAATTAAPTNQMFMNHPVSLLLRPDQGLVKREVA